jgi:hypothetical protein
LEGYTVSKTENPTGSLTDAYVPFVDAHNHSVGEAGYDFYVGATLGNNGRLMLTPATGIALTKTMAPGATQPDSAFQFVIHNVTDPADNGLYPARILHADGSRSVTAVQFVDGQATVALNAGETFYIGGMKPGTVFTVAEVETLEYVPNAESVEVTIVSGQLAAVEFINADRGTGNLTIKSDYKHGVVSKDDLVIANATLTVEAASTALDGKDCVMMQGVTATITAGSNGVRSDNAEDAGRGYVYIADSTMTITAGTDGIEAENYLRADNATLTITTGEGSDAASPATQMNWGKWGSWGKTSSDTSGSWKALKSGGDLEINGGTYTIDSQDDSIHTNGNLLITDGTFTLMSGDDGIHADNELLISGGEFLIAKAYEGI